MSSIKKADSVLLRFKEQDGVNSISSETFENLMNATGMSKTELIHFALSNLVTRYIPAYEQDDGPLTEAQIRMLNEISQVQQVPDDSFELLS
ncbi:hypothetical protein [Pectobacterium carotovorum]|uniref:hypothetical protein n=1 Tax=Pectobacterium carotovorum TaxID=554 RepID=UPI0013738E10|nr:hypothetical protein [Pectobacterium carotovorum]QHP58561.1 hypothetical protein EH204_11565 [Pectobacterium carotovorum subsp. carotovorum]